MKNDSIIARNTSKYDTWIAAILLVLFTALVLWKTRGLLEGDPSIYYTYLKNFFDLPFSYADGVVSHGCTSFLYVIFYSIVYAISGSYWLIGIKIFTILLLALSMFFITKIFDGKWEMLAVALAMLLWCPDIIHYTAVTYEIGLMFFMMALLIYLLCKQRVTLAVFVSGLLYLVRPELALVTIAVDLALLYQSQQRIKTCKTIIISGVPVVVISLYMFWHTGSFVSSSVVGRAITSMEDGRSWALGIVQNAQILWRYYQPFIIILAIALIVYVVRNKRIPGMLLLVFGAILLPYVIVPPLAGYGRRYLALIVMAFLIAVCYLWSCINRYLNKNILSVVLALLIIVPSVHSFMTTGT